MTAIYTEWNTNVKLEHLIYSFEFPKQTYSYSPIKAEIVSKDEWQMFCIGYRYQGLAIPRNTKPFSFTMDN
jgi:hypothetical protein